MIQLGRINLENYVWRCPTINNSKKPVRTWPWIPPWDQPLTKSGINWATIEHRSHVVSRSFSIYLGGFDYKRTKTSTSFLGFLLFLSLDFDPHSGFLTGVSTVHCRKRKIRCLLASDDTRCENCIRLKKECHFFPVDQQPPMETKRSRSGSKTGATSTEASITSSPPALGGGGIVDQSDSYFQYAPMPMNSGQDISPFEPAPFATNPMPNFSPGLSAHVWCLC